MIHGFRRFVELLGWWSLPLVVTHWLGISFPTGPGIWRSIERKAHAFTDVNHFHNMEGSAKALTVSRPR